MAGSRTKFASILFRAFLLISFQYVGKLAIQYLDSGNTKELVMWLLGNLTGKINSRGKQGIWNFCVYNICMEEFQPHLLGNGEDRVEWPLKGLLGKIREDRGLLHVCLQLSTKGCN